MKTMQTNAYQSRTNFDNTVMMSINPGQSSEINTHYSWSQYAKVNIALTTTLIGAMLINPAISSPSSLLDNDAASPETADSVLDDAQQLISPQETLTFADNSLPVQPRHAKRAGFGVEFQISTYSASSQGWSSVAGLTSGDFVVMWMSYGQDGSRDGIYGQRYSSKGVAQGGEFQVNTYTTDYQGSPSIAALTTGDFVVVWSSDGQDGDSYGIYGQRFLSTGVPQGSEFQINTYTTSWQMDPSVAALSAGDFVVVWTSDGQDGSQTGIYGQRFSNTGVPQGNEFQINTYTALNQMSPSVVGLSTGNFVVAWTSGCSIGAACSGSLNQDASGYGIFGQRFSNTGVPQGSEFQINTYTTGSQISSAIAVLNSDDFVVAWASGCNSPCIAQDGSSYGIYGQRYSSTGIPQGNEFQINTYTIGSQGGPSIAVLSSGDFMVAWGSDVQDGSIYGQRYSSTGTPQGSEFQINTYTTGSQRRPSVAVLSSDDFVVTWDSDGQDGYGLGIYGRIYFNNDMPPTLISNTLTINEGATVILNTLNLNTFDLDSGHSELTFTVSNVQYGQFEYTSNAGITITSFTQQDIIDGNIQFAHDGTKNKPAYDVSVTDGGLTDGPVSANIIFVYIAQNQLVVQPSEALILGREQLDIQTQLAPTDLEIRIVDVQFGHFEKNDGSWKVTTIFDLFELNTGKIRFVHDGTENKPQYILQLIDLSTNYTFTRQIIGNTILNHAPELTNPIGVVNKQINEAFSYTLPNNVFIDPDAQMLQVIVTPLNGTVFPAWISFDNQTTTLSGTPVAVGSHTFKAIATDPYDATAEDRFYIDVQSTTSGTPTLTTNTLTLLEDQTVVLTSSDLSADDPDGDNNSLVFTVSNVQNGQLEKVANPGISITTFTQLEVINGNVQFVHDGNENAPYYAVRVSDGITASTDEVATITFTNVNDMPVLSNYNMLITSPGQSITLNGNYLSAMDIDNDDNTLTFTISNTQNCRFELTTSPGTPITSFTQQQIQNGNIQFVHTQVANLPIFQVSVSDGSLSTTLADAMTFQIINNQLVVAPGQTVPITVDNINVLSQHPAMDTLIIVTNVANGYFMQTTNPGQSINSFSLQQIKDGEISFVKDNKDNAPSYDIKLSYTNANQITPPATPDITLNHPPIVATKIQNQQASKAKPFDFTISENTFYDPDGDPLIVSAEMQDGSTKPTWLQFEPNYRNNQHHFFGTPATPGGVPIRVVARDPYNASANADFLLQVMGNVTNIFNEGTNPVPFIAAIIGGTALLGGCVATGILYFKKAQDRKTRQQHKFSQRIRHHLKLQNVDNFESEDGQRFVQAVQDLSNLLQEEQGINIENMDENRLDDLASSIAVSAKNKITPDTTKFFNKSKIGITDFADNIEKIARDNQLDDISYAEVSDDVSIPMHTM